MNLNEECLLQFLKNDLPPKRAEQTSGQDTSDLTGGFLTRNLRRILRHKNYVSFPVGLLIRRPEEE
jgi:hypothetical protein